MPAEPSDTDAEFAALLDRAIRDRGITLSNLSRRLGALGSPISIGALSYWRSGRRRPERGSSLDALTHLEQILDLAPGALVQRLGPSRRLAPDHCEHFDELIGMTGGLEEVLASIGFESTDELVSTGGAVTVDVGPDRRTHRTTNRIHWRARHDGVGRAATYVQLDAPSERIPGIRAVSGCQIGQGCYDPASGLVAWELLLDRQLTVGESTITEVALDIAEPRELQFYNCVAERRVGEGVLWVRFDPRALPSEVTAFEETAAQGARSWTVRLVGTSAHHIVQGFGPGAFGLSWIW